MNKKILSFSLSICITFITFPSFAFEENTVDSNSIKIGTDFENNLSNFLGNINSFIFMVTFFPILFVGIGGSRQGKDMKGGCFLQTELNTVKTNINNNLDKSTGGILGLNFQSNFTYKKYTDQEFVLITEATPSFLFKKGYMLAFIGDFGCGLKKENLFGFLDTSLVVGLTSVTAIDNTSSNFMTIPKYYESNNSSSGFDLPLVGGYFTRFELGVRPLTFIENNYLNLTWSVGYRFFSLKDVLGINSINSSIRLGF